MIDDVNVSMSTIVILCIMNPKQVTATFSPLPCLPFGWEIRLYWYIIIIMFDILKIASVVFESCLVFCCVLPSCLWPDGTGRVVLCKCCSHRSGCCCAGWIKAPTNKRQVFTNFPRCFLSHWDPHYLYDYMTRSTPLFARTLLSYHCPRNVG